MTNRPRAGFTLAEMMVVLFILSILTLVAVTTTDLVVDQGRIDNTRQTISSVEKAILGPQGQRQADGTLSITGFVADMGRMPGELGADDTLSLQELWNAGLYLNAQLYSLKPATTLVNASPGANILDVNNPTAVPPDQLVIGSGYRGPYLQLPLGSALLHDSWGNPFAIDFLTVGGRTRSVSIQSGGGPPPYNGFIPSQPKIVSDGFSIVSGLIREKANQGGTFVFRPSAGARVYLLEPDGNGGVHARYTTTDVNGQFAFVPVNSNDLGVSIGPRIIRAVKTFQPPNPNPSMLGAIDAKDTLNITVTPGALTNLTLNLVPPDPYNQVTPEQPMAPETPEP